MPCKSGHCLGDIGIGEHVVHRQTEANDGLEPAIKVERTHVADEPLRTRVLFASVVDHPRLIIDADKIIAYPRKVIEVTTGTGSNIEQAGRLTPEICHKQLFTHAGDSMVGTVVNRLIQVGPAVKKIQNS